MNKILILNLGTKNDIASSARLIGAIKKENSQSQIETLVDTKNANLANILNGITKVHTLDIEKIVSLYSNNLYSNAFALNEFTENLSILLDTHWNQVINYSNDDISSFLISTLDAKECIGSTISTTGAVVCSNQWSIYQNYVATLQARMPIDKMTIRNHMMNLPIQNDFEKIKQDANYSLVAGQNFRRIREMKGSPGTFVVGLCLEQTNTGKNFDLNTMIEIIEGLEESNDYKVVLLLNGKNYQREIANQLNKEFNNTLISINIDTVALPSVIANLDAVVSYSNEILMIADLMETKCVEIRDWNAHIYSPSILHAENHIIYDKNCKQLASDILLSLNEEFGTELPLSCLKSENPIYKSVVDEYGYFFTQVRGDINIQEELRYHIGRSYFFQMLGYPKNNELLKHIQKNTDSEKLLHFVSNLKEELTNAVKLLLGTLRSLKGVKNSDSGLQSFINHLDQLMMIGKNNNISGDVVRFFEGKIENIYSNDIDANIKAIETYLFELKADLQVLTGYLGDLVAPKENTETLYTSKI